MDHGAQMTETYVKHELYHLLVVNECCPKTVELKRTL